MKYRWVCVFMLLWFTLLSSNAQVQVYVTTQDFSSLRLGPGVNFGRIAILDPAITLRAVGRSPTSDWIQVEYNEQRGWISANLLVWTGDLVSLPVDGVDPVPYIRMQPVTGTFSTEAPIYNREIVGSDFAGTLPANTVVELVGRLGDPSNGQFWVQILYEGKLYWTGSWNINLTNGSFYDLLDTSYLYPFGRLVTTLSNDIANTFSAVRAAEFIWQSLNGGEAVACDLRIELAKTSRATETDIRQEPIFAPTLAALDSAIVAVNSALAAFQDACNRTELLITQKEVRDNLRNVDDARRSLNLALSLLNSLEQRNPLLGN